MRPPGILGSLSTVALASLLFGCGGGTSTAPDTSASALVALGPQVLRVTACGFTPPAPVFPLLYSRVTVSRAGAEWIATAAIASGDVELRFHQVGAALNGSMMIAGTIKGTAINVPALAGSLPAWDGGMTFGGNAATTINGVAFSASALFPTAGLDGTGAGALTITDNAGRTCSATGFSWALFAQS
ncbi:MAG TPA: hypothetical protein VF921_17360 [Vicinamibacterales bacterium]